MLSNINKKGVSKLFILIAGILLMLSLAILVKALTDNERSSLQNELSQLENNLTNNGYNWLINYSIDYNSINDTRQVNVYREGDNRLLATFNNITSSGWYKIYLTNLNDNESYSTFDLKSVGLVDKTMPRDILLKKMRIDEIKHELNNYGVKNG